jgi:aminoglycoside 2'-N-acetyltransferase I
VIEVRHTADLDASTLDAARALLYRVFDDMTEHDWEHALGGMHAMVWDEGELVAHASVVQRRLIVGGKALRTGYVEGVAVREDRRRRGHGGAVMDALERIIRRAYDLGALGATDMAARFYAARGWQLWRGPAWVLGRRGTERTPDEDGAIWVLGSSLDLTSEITCDWRDGDVW